MKERFPRRDALRIIPLGIAGTILLTQEKEADANILGIVFRVASYGFGTVLFGVAAIGALAVGATAAVGYGLYSRFRGGSSGDNSYAYNAYAPDGWVERTPPKPIVVSASFDPKERVAGNVLRIRAIEHDLLKNDGIALPRGGRLMIEEDGVMQFADTRFRGYAMMQNDRSLSVWTPDRQLVLMRKPHQTKIHNLHHDSHDGGLALVSLLGDIDHA